MMEKKYGSKLVRQLIWLAISAVVTIGGGWLWVRFKDGGDWVDVSIWIGLLVPGFILALMNRKNLPVCDFFFGLLGGILELAHSSTLNLGISISFEGLIHFALWALFEIFLMAGLAFVFVVGTVIMGLYGLLLVPYYLIAAFFEGVFHVEFPGWTEYVLLGLIAVVISLGAGYFVAPSDSRYHQKVDEAVDVVITLHPEKKAAGDEEIDGATVDGDALVDGFDSASPEVVDWESVDWNGLEQTTEAL